MATVTSLSRLLTTLWCYVVGRAKFHYAKYRLPNPQPLTLKTSDSFVEALVDDPSYQNLLNFQKQHNDPLRLITWIELQGGDRLKSALSTAPETWLMLKDATDMAQILHDMPRFKQAVHDYDAQIQLSSAQACFYGRGHGMDSLNIYRKIESNNTGELFEKIYLKTSRDWQLQAWLYAQLQPHLNPEVIKLPALISTQEGERLVAAYFEFIKDPLDDIQAKKSLLQRGIAIQQELWRISSDYPELLKTLPKNVDQLSAIPLFNACLQRLASFEQELNKYLTFEFNMHWLQHQLAIVNQHPKQLCHGDIHGKNLSSAGWVIDWDNLGYYPIGYDMALLLSKVQNIYSIEQLEQVIEQNVLMHYSASFALKIKINMMFLMAVLYARKVNERITMEMLASILEWLERHAH
ncbi:aminoglycoside phosphotransferase [Thiomicrospira aerophila AL3]|uniref:Aminoglycoside phosphotransferase n=1 Tax=Thiomicrospira aerophila AL3 TaxID=717772 RepID=W0DVS9_9GAMM|nr:phosphotransferase [Thiomicrospira aerophila]AHF01094.1 aminoglycoside phosphotransferase [Thiomicrospira aerophila AL3]